MPTLIDELVVRLGLDAKDFTKGQKEAAASFLKTKEAAAKTGKDIEDTARKAGAGIERLTRNVITLFATIAGARGLADLVTGLTQANAELGRFGANVGLSPQRVAAWGAAVQQVGGNAGQAQQTLAKLSGTFTAFRNGLGDLPPAFFALMGKTGVRVNPLADTEEHLTGISTAIQKLSRTDRKTAFNLAESLGIDAATFEVMRQYGPEINKHLKSLEKVGPTDAAIKSAEKLQKAWAGLVQTLGKVAQRFMEVISPHLTALVENFTNLIERLANDVDWDAMGEGFGVMAKASGELMSNMDGATVALAAFFALWTGAQFTKALANMLILRGLGSAPTGGGGVLAFLGRLSPWIAMLSLSGDTPKGGAAKNWDEDATNDAFIDQQMRKNGQGNMRRGRRNSYQMSLDRSDAAREAQMDDYTRYTMGDVKVDGRKVSRGNPLPVAIEGGSGTGSGGGFWSTVGNAISNFFGGDTPAPSSTGSGNSKDVDDSGIPNGTPSGKVTGSAKRLMDRLVGKHGWTPQAASIAAGNAWAESSFKPGIMGDPQVPGGSWGLFQWNRSRLSALKKFAASRKADWKDFDTQVDFFAKEANAMIPEWKGQTNLANADRIGKRYEGYRGPIQRKRSAQAANYLRGYTPPLDQSETSSLRSDVVGANMSAAMNSISNDNRRNSSVSNDTRIGNISIQTQATDSKGIADALWEDLLRRTGQSTAAAAANTGPI